MRDKFRNKSSEWKYRKILSNESWFKHISDCREVMRPWWNKDVSSWKWKVNSSIISPDKEYPHTYINGCVVFFFFFSLGRKNQLLFFFPKKDVHLFCWWWWRDLYLTKMNVLKSLCLTLNLTRVSSKCFSKTLKISFYKVKWI